MSKPLENMIALVTGAARGIGRSAAIALAKAGAHVICLARTTGALEEVDDEIQKAGGTATLVPLNIRDFPALDRLGLLARQGATVSYAEPAVDALARGAETLRSLATEDALTAAADCYVICTNHDVFDYAAIVKGAPVIVDTRNALKSHTGSSIFRL